MEDPVELQSWAWGTVGPRTERILGQEKTRSAQNRSDWGQAYIVKCKNTNKCVQFEVKLIYYMYRSAWGQYGIFISNALF